MMSKYKITSFFKFIRFSHTLFALPFALGAAIVAADGLPNTKTLFLIILAMVFARTAAMLFNRLVDWEIDKKNPRTKDRSTLVNKKTAWLMMGVSSIAFVASTWYINSLCFFLSPVALIIICFYSLTKRFFACPQLFLGLALAVAPVGAWLAVTGEFSGHIFILALAVMLWVAGFDTIYAMLDYDFDTSVGLKSLVVAMGKENAARLAIFLHVFAWLLLFIWGFANHLTQIYYILLAINGSLLIFEHYASRHQNNQKINQTFFTCNAIFSAVWLIAIISSV